MILCEGGLGTRAASVSLVFWLLLVITIYLHKSLILSKPMNQEAYPTSPKTSSAFQIIQLSSSKGRLADFQLAICQHDKGFGFRDGPWHFKNLKWL